MYAHDSSFFNEWICSSIFWFKQCIDSVITIGPLSLFVSSDLAYYYSHGHNSALWLFTPAHGMLMFKAASALRLKLYVIWFRSPMARTRRRRRQEGTLQPLDWGGWAHIATKPSAPLLPRRAIKGPELDESSLATTTHCSQQVARPSPSPHSPATMLIFQWLLFFSWIKHYILIWLVINKNSKLLSSTFGKRVQ